MNTTNEKAKCPNCGQYKMISRRTAWRTAAMICLLGAGISSILCIILIGIPFLIFFVLAAPICFIVSFFAKGAGCQNCKFQIK